jgi:hypothetical protein
MHTAQLWTTWSRWGGPNGLCCGVAWRGVAWRGVAWRGVAWRGVAWRGVAWRGVVWFSCTYDKAKG